MEEDEDWEIFADELWQYQYIREPCQRTPELSHALYYECQGITDFAIKIFMLAQARAISTGKEKLTVGIIKSVAKDCLRTAREVLDALKAGNMTQLRNCEDVSPSNIEKFIEEQLQQLSVDDSPTFSSEPLESLVGHEIEQQEQVQQQNSDFFKPKPTPCQANVFKDSSSKTRKTRKNLSKYSKNSEREKSLIDILSNGKRCSITAYEVFLEAGYIQPITEYFSEIIA
jgi:bacterioferritin-associated ferredoxin